MPKTRSLLLALLCGASLLISCAPAAAPDPAPAAAAVTLPTPTPESTPLPTEPPTAAPTALPTAEPTLAPAPVDWTTTASVEGDYYVLGNPQAPIRLIDFSDFF